MDVRNFTVSPSAIANGEDQNTAAAQIFDDAGNPAPRVNVVFDINNSAIFQHGTQKTTVETDALGYATVGFVNTVSETVIIGVMLANNPASYQTLTTEFTQSSGEVDRIRMLVTINEAKADGKDRNEVVVQTMNGTVQVPNTPVSLSLTHGAVFIHGDSKADIITDSYGLASMPFSNTTPGPVTITAYLTHNISIYEDAEASFDPVVPEGKLTLSIVTDNATANGQTYNSVMALVTNSENGTPVPGANITFRVSGSALFANGSTTFCGTTNTEGNIFATLSDTLVEAVQVTAALGADTEAVQIHFTEQYAPLHLVRVFNKNKTILSGMPSIAWRGAVFYIEAAGGTGNYEWAVTEGSDVLRVTESHSNQATLLFESDSAVSAERTYVITLRDGEESVEYSFYLNRFFTKFGEWEFYHSFNPNRYPPISVLQELYNQWGNMGSYEGWFESNSVRHYWSNDFDWTFPYAINLANGEVDWYLLTTLCGYAGS